jgi:hypothetical protein
MSKKIQEVIKENMNLLQEMMEAGKHLTDRDSVVNQFNKCMKYSNNMNDEDGDYLSCAGTAIEKQLPWEVQQI